ncbi:MAG TPA: lytic transglycosylase domain-containing protein [Deltaproteobacteria bacterium]|nr:lytic transglycosylase domain-containing protein [Deltaproteobacteria bacterium]HOI06295.1 lytic transglycosylase domain-containing protein [Deltaproteobacteria bacterium]
MTLRTAFACIMLSALFLVLQAVPAYADIFKKRLPDGTLCFTNTPMGGDWDLYLRETKGNKYRYTRPSAAEMVRRSNYDGIIRRCALNNGVDPELVKGIIHVESRYNPLALSPKGAMGLMQLMPDTASGLGVRDPWDPHENIAGGTKFISYLIKRYNGDLTKALAAYNAGPGAVDQYNGIPPYQETQDYVRSVLSIVNGGRKW